MRSSKKLSATDGGFLSFSRAPADGFDSLPSLGFQFNVKILQEAFPNRVEIETKLTRKRLRALLTNQRFDIVHLMLAVDWDNGDLILSPIDFDIHPAKSQPDTMPSRGFANLLESRTRLVILATRRASLTAVQVARVANMAASDAEITGEAAEEWDECFCGLLPR